METKVVSFEQMPELIRNLVDELKHLKKQFARSSSHSHLKEN